LTLNGCAWRFKQGLVPGHLSVGIPFGSASHAAVASKLARVSLSIFLLAAQRWLKVNVLKG
jgi:hypothetical protein